MCTTSHMQRKVKIENINFLKPNYGYLFVGTLKVIKITIKIFDLFIFLFKAMFYALKSFT